MEPKMPGPGYRQALSVIQEHYIDRVEFLMWEKYPSFLPIERQDIMETKLAVVWLI